VAGALLAIPNPDLGWDEWNRIGMAAWRATGGAAEGLNAWAAWSAKSAKHAPATCADRWQHFGASPPARIGAGTLFFLAKAAGWQRPQPASDSQAPDDAAFWREVEPVAPQPEPQPKAEAKPKKAKPGRDGSPRDQASADAVLLTEHHVALAFKEQHRDTLRFCHDTGAWFIWTGTHWRQDRTHAAFSYARDLVAQHNREAEFKTQAITGKAAFAGGVEQFARSKPGLSEAGMRVTSGGLCRVLGSCCHARAHAWRLIGSTRHPSPTIRRRRAIRDTGGIVERRAAQLQGNQSMVEQVRLDPEQLTALTIAIKIAGEKQAAATVAAALIGPRADHATPAEIKAAFEDAYYSMFPYPREANFQEWARKNGTLPPKT
jgi:hypothetical protein